MTGAAEPVDLKRQWWLPSLGVCLWLVFFLGLNLTGWRWTLINSDGDPSLHWRIGNWMIEHRQIIRADQFSHTRTAAPVVTKEWLSEVLFAVAGNLLGWPGAVFLTAAAIATWLWLLHRQLLGEGNELLLATALTLVAAYASTMHWLARPHVMTHLLTVVYAWRLRAFDRQEASARSLCLALAPLMALWANLHGSFFNGLVLIGTYAVGTGVRMMQVAGAERAIERKKLVTLAIVAAACLVASFANPNGWQLHLHIVSFLRTPLLAGLANEFASPNFHSSTTHGFALQLLVLALMLLVTRRRLEPTEMLLIAVWGYFALRAARNIPIFAIVTAPILAAHWNAYLKDAADSRWLRLYRKLSANALRWHGLSDGRVLIVVAVTAMAMVLAVPRFIDRKPLVDTDIMPSLFPVEAAAFVRANPDKIAGEMFNDYGWGGYLMLAVPERKVFIDGRNDFYGADLVREFLKPYYVEPGWESVLQKYNVEWTILPVNHPLCTILALRTDWKPVHRDQVAVIHTRGNPDQTRPTN